MATVWLFLVTGHLGEDVVRSVEEDCAPLCVAVAAPPGIGLEVRPCRTGTLLLVRLVNSEQESSLVSVLDDRHHCPRDDAPRCWHCL